MAAIEFYKKEFDNETNENKPNNLKLNKVIFQQCKHEEANVFELKETQ